ncbi:sulfite exporter TauE/SafE family protein [Denitromonas iodatirespirans]|uniref:Probable membrane transporter protein n=1 Tax=Denitromonas iodatirespirans TaxID=2795389 RepID=A0A944DD01_DENI1|nr:sulfite exporter TauE/SafE family protein [Denitromonas iodatirespirans]MBT0962218.1 sulfite exporter TauE/SafE family protein [Denitromonas iodatirespirans]
MVAGRLAVGLPVGGRSRHRERAGPAGMSRPCTGTWQRPPRRTVAGRRQAHGGGALAHEFNEIARVVGAFGMARLLLGMTCHNKLVRAAARWAVRCPQRPAQPAAPFTERTTLNEITHFLAARDALTWAVVLLAALAGGALRGLTGFGAALLMAPLMSLVLSARETMCLVTLLNALPMGRTALRTASRAIDRQVMLPMSMAAFAGVPCGIALVGALPAQAFGMVVGGAVILSAIGLMSGAILVKGRSLRLSLGVGMLSGVLTGFGGVGGPPAILYLLGVEPDGHRARANFIVFFAVLYPVAVLAVAALGLLSWADILLGLSLAPLFHVGGIGGARLYRHLGKRHFRPVVLVLLIAAGVMAAWPRDAHAAVAPGGDRSGAHCDFAFGAVPHPAGAKTTEKGAENCRANFKNPMKNNGLMKFCATRKSWHLNC